MADWLQSYIRKIRLQVLHMFMNPAPIGIRKSSSRALNANALANLIPLGELIPNVKVNSDSEQLPKKRGPKTAMICKRTFYGATYLLDAIGQVTGVKSDLKICFPDSYKQILSLVYYLTLEEANSMSRFTRWASMHHHPWSKDIPSQRISELFQSISEENKQQFFRLQGKRRMEHEYLAYDTTSVSSYSKTLKQIKYTTLSHRLILLCCLEKNPDFPCTIENSLEIYLTLQQSKTFSTTWIFLRLKR